MPDDASVPKILGRYFLTTASTVINVKNGKLKFQVRKKEIEFNFSSNAFNFSLTNEIFSVEATNDKTQEHGIVTNDYDTLGVYFHNVGCAETENVGLARGYKDGKLEEKPNKGTKKDPTMSKEEEILAKSKWGGQSNQDGVQNPSRSLDKRLSPKGSLSPLGDSAKTWQTLGMLS